MQLLPPPSICSQPAPKSWLCVTHNSEHNCGGCCFSKTLPLPTQRTGAGLAGAGGGRTHHPQLRPRPGAGQQRGAGVRSAGSALREHPQRPSGPQPQRLCRQFPRAPQSCRSKNQPVFTNLLRSTMERFEGKAGEAGLPSREVRSRSREGLSWPCCSPFPIPDPPQNTAAPVPSSPRHRSWEQSGPPDGAGFFHKVSWLQAGISKFRKVNIHPQAAPSSEVDTRQPQPRPCAPGWGGCPWLLPPSPGRAAGSCPPPERCLSPQTPHSGAGGAGWALLRSMQDKDGGRTLTPHRSTPRLPGMAFPEEAAHLPSAVLRRDGLTTKQAPNT